MGVNIINIEMHKGVFIDIEINPERLRNIADKIEYRNKNRLPGLDRVVETLNFDGGEIRFLCKGKVD